MKAFAIVSGLLYATLLALHVWRVIVEGAHILADPYFAVSSAAAAIMAAWAFSLIVRRS